MKISHTDLQSVRPPGSANLATSWVIGLFLFTAFVGVAIGWINATGFASLGGLLLAALITIPLGLLVFQGPFKAIILLIIIKPLIDSTWFLHVAGGSLNLQSLVAVAVLFAACMRLIADRRLLTGMPFERWILAIVFTHLIALARSPDLQLGIADFFRITHGIVFFFMGFHYFRTERQLHVLFLAVACSAIWPILSSLFEAVDWLQASDASGDPRLRGLYQHPFDIASRVLVALPFFLVAPRLFDDRRWQYISWGYLLVTATVLSLLDLRTAWLAFAVLVLLWCILTRNLKLLIALFILVSIACVMVPSIPVRIWQVFAPLGGQQPWAAGSGRLGIWAAALLGYIQGGPLDWIFGLGLRSVRFVVVNRLHDLGLTVGRGPELSLYDAHSDYIRLIVENGVIGLLTACGFVISLWRFLSKHTNSSMLSIRLGIIKAWLSTLTVTVVTIAFSFTPLLYPSVSMIFWLALGVGSKIIADRPQER